MNGKASRLQTIRQVIKTECVRSQEYLLDKLIQKGYSITQATLSRDLKILEVAKISDGKNGYYYTLPEDSNRIDYRTGFVNDLQRGLMTIAFSGKMAVARTRIGHANSIALALDNLEIESILGTIAGDDTVLIILSESAIKEQFINELKVLVPGVIML